MNTVEVEATHSRTARLAALWVRRVAKEFPTDKELKTYLKDHPDADPKNHSVVDGEGSSEGAPDEEMFDGSLKTLDDPEKRKGIFSRLWQGIKATPKAVAGAVKAAVIDEYNDWKALANGVRHAIKGGDSDVEEDTKTRIIHLATKSTMFALGITAGLKSIIPPPGGLAAKLLVNAVVSPIMRKHFAAKMAKQEMSRWSAGLGTAVAGLLTVASEDKKGQDAFDKAFQDLIADTTEEALTEIMAALKAMDVTDEQVANAVAEAKKS